MTIDAKHLINWVGGKRLLRKIISNLAPDDIQTYIEPFGGGGWVLFFKDRWADVEIYNDLDGRLALAQVERTAGQLAVLGVLDESLGRAVFNDECNLACALPVVDRTRDRTNLVRRQIAENKLRRIEQCEHDNIVLADAVRAQRMSKTVGLGVQFAVGPAAAGTRVKECRSAAETRNIAQKTVQIGETGFKCVAEHGNIIGVFVTQGLTSE